MSKGNTMSKTTTCMVCGEAFTHTKRSTSQAPKTCSKACNSEARRRRMRLTWAEGKIKPREGICNEREKNPRWRGGTSIRSGYRFIWTPEGYRREHRMVMERVLGRPLLDTEVVHHINGDRLDNRPENLKLIESNSAHQLEHIADGTSHIERSRVEVCADCGDNFRTMNTGFGAQRFCLRCRRRARNGGRQ